MHDFYYSLFTFSWPWFESGSLRNGGMLLLRIYFAVDSMPIEMYGESWIAGLLTSDDVMLYMAGFGTYSLRIHGMNYTEVINASSAGNST